MEKEVLEEARPLTLKQRDLLLPTTAVAYTRRERAEHRDMMEPSGGARPF